MEEIITGRIAGREWVSMETLLNIVYGLGGALYADDPEHTWPVEVAMRKLGYVRRRYWRRQPRCWRGEWGYSPPHRSTPLPSREELAAIAAGREWVMCSELPKHAVLAAAMRELGYVPARYHRRQPAHMRGKRGYKLLKSV